MMYEHFYIQTLFSFADDSVDSLLQFTLYDRNGFGNVSNIILCFELMGSH